MIKSMTGFGHGEFVNEKYHFTVEIKSVNHRYLDMNIRLPKKLGLFENAVRTLLKEYLERGKVDVFITYEDLTEGSSCLRCNENMAAQYLSYLREMAEKFQIENDVTVSKLAGFTDVFVMEEEPLDEEELWGGLEQAVKSAAERFTESRAREGEHLKQDLLEKLAVMDSYVDVIEARSPVLLEEYRQRLSAKLQEVVGDTTIDESRIAAEVVIYADRICVDEETVRLRSHIKGTKDALNAGGSIGRKLDFIAQEMNREANTILSKTTDLELSNIGISLKTDIEKVREQIQNIE